MDRRGARVARKSNSQEFLSLAFLASWRFRTIFILLEVLRKNVKAVAMTKPETNRALVVGLGLTGMACVRHLVARGYDVTVVDTRARPPKLDELRREFPRVAAHTGGLPAAIFSDPGLLVVSPGVSIKEPAIARAVGAGAQAIGDIELFAREATAPVIAITGANGKSTVTALTGEMCRRARFRTAVGGNIGVPALSLLGDRGAGVYVVEVSR